MEIRERALRLKIYLGEADRHAGQPLYKAVVLLLRERGVWGATATRGVLGFGKRSALHAATPLRLSEDLPIVIEAVDRASKIEALLPEITDLVKDGLVTTEEVDVHTRL
jgi:PII-like signaling protein